MLYDFRSHSSFDFVQDAHPVWHYVKSGMNHLLSLSPRFKPYTVHLCSDCLTVCSYIETESLGMDISLWSYHDIWGCLLELADGLPIVKLATHDPSDVKIFVRPSQRVPELCPFFKILIYPYILIFCDNGDRVCTHPNQR